MHLSLSRAFQRHQEEHNLKHPSSMDLMITIQNKTKQPAFLLSMHSSSLRAFQKHEEHDLKHSGLVDLISTKQNKTNYLPSIYAPRPRWELSKNTKNMIWSIRVWWISYLQNKTKQNKQPSFIYRWYTYTNIGLNFARRDKRPLIGYTHKWAIRLAT
jgi:hypothetical protein